MFFDWGRILFLNMANHALGFSSSIEGESRSTQRRLEKGRCRSTGYETKQKKKKDKIKSRKARKRD